MKSSVLGKDKSIASEVTEHVICAHASLVDTVEEPLSFALRTRVLGSWKGCMTLIPRDAVSKMNASSLRQPQISALYKILAHLTSHKVGDATVVMPTGTGKTETLLAAVCGFPVERALVLVPTDSLRQQTFKKFLHLGILRELNAIKNDTLNPIVALLEGGISTEDELELLIMANVIITTPHSLRLVRHELQSELYSSCSHLFVDEAHHVAASTWTSIKNAFKDKPVIQFTATPFRQDRNKVGGEIIYNFPMSMAQKLGIFRSINFRSIYEVNDLVGDKRVAEVAVEQLIEDREGGLDHILMARCNTRTRAGKIFEIYNKNYSHLNPILIHSGVIKLRTKLDSILNKEHKIIVCVDMLGEGFDLPELKVCALHDIHKSLAITLQFAGRFVRDREDLGNPTFVANVCDQQVESVLKDLYIEDPDWNKVLRKVSESNIQRELDLQKVIDGADTTGLEVPLENIHPALSAVVYKIGVFNFDFELDKIPLESKEELVSSFIARDSNLAIFLTKVESKTKWAPQSDLTQPDWRLLILYVVPNENLLFIHDSAKSGSRKKIAEHLSSTASLLNGDRVFKAFGNVQRLVLQNAGLNRGRRGPLRYVMYTGIDIESAINDLAQGASYKSNLFGKGYDNGEKVNIGCSHRGRIWSMDGANLSDWMDWCGTVAKNLNDDTIDHNQILDKVLRTKEIRKIPKLIPISIDWPDHFYAKGISSLILECNEHQILIDDAEITISLYREEIVEFEISFETVKAVYQYTVSSDGYRIKQISGDKIKIRIGTSTVEISNHLSNESSPSVYFEDGSKMFENLHIVRPENFSIPHIQTRYLKRMSWKVNIRNESQGEEKKVDSIQFAMIQHLKLDAYWIIFDDDGPNEIADIVAFKDEGNVLAIEFYHLKYSQSEKPGSRVDDFYQVNGQVIKSCKWVGEFNNIIDQLKKRERKRVNQDKGSRIEIGAYRDFDLLKQHGSRLKKEYRIFVVQPGLNVSKVSGDVLAILGSTDIYVRETTGIGLRVIGS